MQRGGGVVENGTVLSDICANWQLRHVLVSLTESGHFYFKLNQRVLHELKNEISWEKDGNQNNSQFWAGVSQRQGKTIGILLFFLKYQNASHWHSQAEAVCFTKDQQMSLVDQKMSFKDRFSSFVGWTLIEKKEKLWVLVLTSLKD